MITEQDKQAILNGSFGVSRDGSKCKFIGKLYTPDPYNYFFVYFNKVGITHYESLNEDFLENSSLESPLDVVGLWENRQEPFNLKKALTGKPVMTRDRSKAYVQAQIAQPDGLEHYSLIGFGLNGEHNEFLHWDESGKVMADDITCDDIIGMWNVPEPVSNTVTVTLPRALKEPQDEMWFVDTEGYMKSNFGKDIPPELFKNRPYFNSKEDVQTWFQAMQDSRGI